MLTEVKVTLVATLGSTECTSHTTVAPASWLHMSEVAREDYLNELLQEHILDNVEGYFEVEEFEA